jgi:hypothetical protein
MAQYRVPVEETFSWQRPIIDKDLSTPPTSPNKGDRYIVGESATGDWAGQEKKITWYNGTIWKFDAPTEGWICHVLDEDAFYKFSGTVWESYALHTHNNKAILDLIEEAFTSALKTAYDATVVLAHNHSNKIILDAVQEAFTTALKSSYDNAVTNSHAHANKTILDAIEQAFTTILKNKLDGIESGAVSLSTVKADSDIADAISTKHSHLNKTILDAIEVAFTSALKTAYDGAVTNSHTHSNKTILDAIEVALTTTLKSNYDEAYNKRAQYDSDLGCITFDI